MYSGEKVEVGPESFLAEQGSLHLFYDGWFADTRKLWLKKSGVALRPEVDEQWRELSGEEAGRGPSQPRARWA